jgi:hypothetical protein
VTSAHVQGGRRLRAPKVFNISMHRCGTKSVHDLLARSGVASVHWPSTFEGIDYETRAIGHEHDLSYVATLLAPVIADVTAVGDIPIPALYAVLDATYPGSAFILLHRSAAAWVRSVRRHVGARDLDPFERTQYWRYLAARPRSLRSVSDAELSAAFLRHRADVLAHFEGSDRCLSVDLDAAEAGERICRFLGLPALPLHYVNSPLERKPARSLVEHRSAPSS